MATSDVFAGYEDDLLIVKSDDSDYYVPAYSVETLTEMCGGEAYAVFLSGASDVTFTYPTGGGLGTNKVCREIKKAPQMQGFKNIM